MLFSAARMRATETLSIRIKDLDLDSSAKVFVGGEYTKTKTEFTNIIKKYIICFVLLIEISC
ncbi:MAG: hypothetical protein ACJ72U_03035 [Nitrososphaeraceae archaeon]|jgi:hypothetical protein